MAAAKAIYEAVQNPQTLTLVVSATAKRSDAFVERAGELAGKIGGRISGRRELRFPNGSRIVSAFANEGAAQRRTSASLVIVDDAAAVPDEVMRPLRGRNGIWLMSTPRWKRGFFYEAWSENISDWERIRLPATRCRWITREFMSKERDLMSSRQFRQEFLCEFVETVAPAFDMDDVDRAFTREVEPMKLS